MRILALTIALIFTLGTSGLVEAGIFSKKNKKRLPRPANFPIFQKKIREDHKATKRAGKHPKDYQDL